MLVDQIRKLRKIKNILLSIIVTVIVVAWISPFAWMIMVSLRPPEQPFSSGIIPDYFTLINLSTLLTETEAWRYLANSALMSSLSALIAIILGSLAAYGFSRFRFRGRRSLLGSLLVFRALPPIVLSIALFSILARTPLINTVWALVLINSAINLPFCIWNLRTGFEAINPELDDAAMVDGCTRLGALLKVIFPITVPVISATLIFVFMLSWNEYLLALVLIHSAEKRMITTFMASNIGQFSLNYIDLLATAVVATIPLTIPFLFIQRYLVSGLSLGGIKE